MELTRPWRRGEESNEGPLDFASCFGAGGVLETKYTQLPSQEARDEYARWLRLGKQINLAAGEYLGDLYRYGFDTPEAHVIRKALYYGFFVEPRGTRGDLELRGLGPGSYRLEDYVNRRMLGTARGPTAVLKGVNFTSNLLLRAVPVR